MTAFIHEIKHHLQLNRDNAVATFQTRKQANQLLHALSQHTDYALNSLWKKLNLSNTFSLIATGGYGRKELFPYSDVDLLILLNNPASPNETIQLEEFIHLLWDLGLKISTSTRTIKECINECNNDITIKTSLLDARYITGNISLFQTFITEYKNNLNAATFFQEKILELEQRHAKYEDTPYSLEPNCKESPGGLRDLHVILWVAKAAQLGGSWHELAKNNLITITEARKLRRTENAFKDIRIRLHLQTQRQEDRLLFDLQTPIASDFNFKPTTHLRVSEVLMQRYYKAAKIVCQFNLIMLQSIEAYLFPQTTKPQTITERFNEVNGLIDIAHENVFEENKNSILELFLLLTQHSTTYGMTARTARALWHASFKIDDAFRNDPYNHALFLDILKSPKGLTHALRRMNETGILGRYLPNFHKIVGQMQHDLFHVYTVDQHILMVIRNLRRFKVTKHAHEYPLCSQLMNNFKDTYLLYIGALFHDIAKGRGGDHSQLGMKDARDFCTLHKLNEEDTNLIVFLVQHHLLMSHTAQKKDISDPNTIATFANIVQDERHLTALYLLTVADIRGTSPKVWNGWKKNLLEDLYHQTRHFLGGNVTALDETLKNKQETALSLLQKEGAPENAHEVLWKQLDIAYFLRHAANEIAWQTYSFYSVLNTKTPQVKCRPAPFGEGLQIAIYTADIPDLFARICAYFSQNNFNILDAKIHTTKNGYALDTFLVIDSSTNVIYQEQITQIENNLANTLLYNAPLPYVPEVRLSRQSRTFPIKPSISLRPDEQGQYYLLSITAQDQRGLLFKIATTLAKYHINLHTAKIMTLGERVEDVFLIDSPSLKNPRIQLNLETDLLATLQT
jgi:[protein-PII] uridylyltransferase